MENDQIFHFISYLRLPDINKADAISFERQHEKSCNVATLLKDFVTVTVANTKSDQRNVVKSLIH